MSGNSIRAAFQFVTGAVTQLRVRRRPLRGAPWYSQALETIATMSTNARSSSFYRWLQTMQQHETLLQSKRARQKERPA
ncbi:hypothetical protein LJ655_23495 [Paraburkholderia sp. MMS20-SJTN17]|uniref:Uncharacterized protein n=1 Tax=Paraburkholderia translucens TaxID=2886945 RepID=A0ABS8KK78_9BURK|nr:hypothetical protein [Paraburkholderia sp. MMS20-SJTN17]MCC8404802.1 hypothetical protein [Paraburkholderia sp. MMS20-SJTN17]